MHFLFQCVRRTKAHVSMICQAKNATMYSVLRTPKGKGEGGGGGLFRSPLPKRDWASMGAAFVLACTMYYLCQSFDTRGEMTLQG
ncbi:hypothetical protein LY76DRAFT_205841 [Colletotrichum caudatum]|nr:hypothetical protein LY76DRAFT_205841 [Colletotrichum caudatum]